MNNIYTYILAFLSSFFLPVYPIMLSVFVMIIIDAIVAVAIASKMNEEITSKKMKKMFVKILVFESVIIATRIIEMTILPGSNMTVIVATLLLMYEFFSLSEKFKKYTGIPILDHIRHYFIKKLDVPKEDKKDEEGSN